MMDSIKSRSAGVALTGALALASIVLARIPLIERNGLSALTLAIVLGMLVGNWVLGAGESRFTAGIAFGKQTLLRFGIVLYGLRLTFQDIAHVGVAGLLIDTIMLSCTFLLAWWAGTRWFQLDRTTAMLIGAGSAICGAAAVMATDPVVRGRADQVAIAVSTVVVFGTSAIFLYPFLYHLNLEHHIVAMTPGTYRHLRRVHHSRGRPGGGRGPRRGRQRGRYGGDHQDGAGDDVGAVPSVAVGLSGAVQTRASRELPVCCRRAPSSPFPGLRYGSWR